MKPQFFQVGLVIIAFAHVGAVNLRSEGVAVIQLSDGNSYTFEGQEALVVAMAFAHREQESAGPSQQPSQQPAG